MTVAQGLEAGNYECQSNEERLTRSLSGRSGSPVDAMATRAHARWNGWGGVWTASAGIGGTEGHTGAGMGILATGVIGRGDGITGGVGPVYLLCRRS